MARAFATANVVGLSCTASEVFDSMRIGRWLVDQRSAAGAGKLTQARIAELTGIDPWWNPGWPIPWQRAFRIALAHVENRGTLKDLLEAPAEQRMFGEDIGKWARAQLPQWFELQAQRQEMLTWLGFTAPTEPPVPALPAARSQADRFATGLAAATAWAAEHGGSIANIKRKDVAVVDGVEVKAGLWVGNQRQRAAKLTDEQRAALNKLGMRW